MKLAFLVTAALVFALPSASPPRTIEFPGIGAHGIFDPSLESSGKRVWMSYSAVEEPASAPCPSTIERVQTRIAFSDDRGATWRDTGLVNPATPLCLPAPANVGVRVNEVSTLAYQPTAPASVRWKLLWSSYLWVRDAGQGNRLFQHGWIALREAASPRELARAPEQKLFVGAAYEAVNGPALVHLDRVHRDLAGCLAFTEPGVLAAGDALYVALGCNGRAMQKVVLLERRASWRYVGTIGTNMTAPELFLVGDRAYVSLTPTRDGRYGGCRIHGLDLDSAKLGRAVLEIDGAAGTFNGACGWEPASSRTGVLLSEVGDDHVFRIVRTGTRFPR